MCWNIYSTALSLANLLRIESYDHRKSDREFQVNAQIMIREKLLDEHSGEENEIAQCGSITWKPSLLNNLDPFAVGVLKGSLAR